MSHDIFKVDECLPVCWMKSIQVRSVNACSDARALHILSGKWAPLQLQNNHVCAEERRSDTVDNDDRTGRGAEALFVCLPGTSLSYTTESSRIIIPSPQWPREPVVALAPSHIDPDLSKLDANAKLKMDTA